MNRSSGDGRSSRSMERKTSARPKRGETGIDTLAPPPVKYRSNGRVREEPKRAYVNDPMLIANAKIELSRANMLVELLTKHPVLDAKTVHSMAGSKSADQTRTARNWRAARRIIGLPACGTTVYPAFQFQANGLPYPLLRDVNNAMPKEYSDLIRVSWLVSPNKTLGGKSPISAIQEGDVRVVKAATVACKVFVW